MQMQEGGCAGGPRGMGFPGAQGSGRRIKDVRLAQLPWVRREILGDRGCTQSLPSWGAVFVVYLCAWVPRTAQKASPEGLMFRGDSPAPVRSSILKARLNNF